MRALLAAFAATIVLAGCGTAASAGVVGGRSRRRAPEPRDHPHVTVTAIILNVTSRGSHRVGRTFTSRAVIGRLAGLLNGFHAAPDVVIACPSFNISYELRFIGAHRTDVTSDGCFADRVSVDGRTQPALIDQRSELAALADRLLGVKGTQGEHSK